MKPVVEQPRVGSGFVLSKLHPPVWGIARNFKDISRMDGSKLFLSGHTLNATPLLHPFAFTIYPPQEDGCTVGKQKPRFSQWDFPIHHTGATDIIQYWKKGWAWTRSTAVEILCGWCRSCCFLEWSWSWTICSHTCCVRVDILSFRGYLVSVALTARYLTVFFPRLVRLKNDIYSGPTARKWATLPKRLSS